VTYKVFVDGQEGTTGLRIHEYLSGRPDIELLKIAPDKKKDLAERRLFLNEADIVFLCLPDGAAREAVSLVDNNRTRIIDASTAHRTDEHWVYGLPELNKQQRGLIRTSNRVAVPGCHATGFILAVNPLVAEGLLKKDAPLSCHSITGYSGGGKSLIKKYEECSSGEKDGMRAPKPYALKLQHKHLPEMRKWTGLSNPPLFTPIVADFYKGMAVSVPLFPQFMNKAVAARQVRDLLSAYYAGEKFIRVMPFEAEENLDHGYFAVEECNDTNRVDIFVFGNETHILLVSRFDNLGKGASGAAIQNMNLMLGAAEGTGLQTGL
jgi:N-acetyl-gamma-glutamyl-phosphate reductase